jgi:hypothetical protein
VIARRWLKNGESASNIVESLLTDLSFARIQERNEQRPFADELVVVDHGEETAVRLKGVGAS